MSVIALPAALPFGAGSSVGQRRYDVASVSDGDGTLQARLLGPPRWTLGLMSPATMTGIQAGQWQALVMQLRGRVNVLAAWNPGRPAPLGTLGAGATLTLNGAHAIGAATLSVTGGAGQAGKTLLAGDWLQLGSGLGTSQLVMVTADATANGSGVFALSYESPLRAAYSGGAAVTWNKPLGHFRQVGDATSWTFASGKLVSQMSIDLLECWN